MDSGKKLSDLGARPGETEKTTVSWRIQHRERQRNKRAESWATDIAMIVGHKKGHRGCYLDRKLGKTRGACEDVQGGDCCHWVHFQKRINWNHEK